MAGKVDAARLASLKRSVSVAIHHDDRVLIVQRPADDEDLPNAWGLPAASLRSEEGWQEAVLRAGRDKLGVQLRVLRELEEGAIERARYRLEMKLFEAEIVGGTPDVPQADSSVTQYQAWQWGLAADLRPAALAGSLCSQLYLNSQKRADAK